MGAGPLVACRPAALRFQPEGKRWGGGAGGAQSDARVLVPGPLPLAHPPTPGFALVVLVTCSQLPVGDGARAGVQGRSLSPPCPSRAGHHRPFVQRVHTARAPRRSATRQRPMLTLAVAGSPCSCSSPPGFT